jgi:hypothetical protein
MGLLGRNALFGTAVMAALGVPFALSDKDSAEPAAGAAAGNGSPASGLASAVDGASDFAALRQDTTPLEGPAVSDLAEVLRFDITPAWLIERWPRVMNARHAAGDLQAYRVPLVTGPKPGDMAGALTYYFDEEQKLAKIQFQGTTGDANPLANFLIRQYGFERRMAGDPSQMLYDVRRDGRAVGQLVVRNSPLIDASLPQNRFRVELLLQRPSEHRIFSDAAVHRFDSHRWP